MNRQARVVTDDPKCWRDHGNVSLLEAARREARSHCRIHQKDTPCIIPVEVRCADTSTIPPAVFQVQVDSVARVLNPRLDTDSRESA
jgi:hypothetical protein